MHNAKMVKNMNNTYSGMCSVKMWENTKQSKKYINIYDRLPLYVSSFNVHTIMAWIGGQYTHLFQQWSKSDPYSKPAIIPVWSSHNNIHTNHYLPAGSLSSPALIQVPALFHGIMVYVIFLRLLEYVLKWITELNLSSHSFR